MNSTGDDNISVETRIPGGFWGKISGLTRHTLWDVMIILLIGVLFYMVWLDEKDRLDFRDKVHQQLADNATAHMRQFANQETLLKAVSAVGEEQRAMTYVLTLSEAERKNLKLAMPQVLRDRVK